LLVVHSYVFIGKAASHLDQNKAEQVRFQLAQRLVACPVSLLDGH
jgi:hypothetical protein